jgi:hypothetical protein
MKKLNSFKTTALFLVGMSLPLIGHCQTYDVSTSVPNSGLYVYCDLNGVQCGAEWSSVGMNETATINAASPTIQEVGSLSVPVSGPITQSFNLAYQFPAVFPNPPQTVPVDATVSISIGSPSISFPFDTGARVLTWAGGNSWQFDGTAVTQMPYRRMRNYSLLSNATGSNRAS